MSPAERRLFRQLGPHALERLVEGLRTLAQALAFFVRHFRLENFDHAATADDARQRQRDAKFLLIAADRNPRTFVIEHHLGDPCRYDADSVLAGIMALDDGDVGIAHVSLELVPKLVNPLAAPGEQCRDGNATDACGGPEKYLRGPVVANDLGLDMPGIDTETLAQVNSKSLAVEIRACAQHHRAGARLARHVGDPFPTSTRRRLGRFRMPACSMRRKLTPLSFTPAQPGSLRTGTRCAARPRRSSSRSSWRWPRRYACRRSSGPRAGSTPAACCRRAARQACPTA